MAQTLLQEITSYAGLGYDITFKTAMGGFFMIRIKKRAFNVEDDKYLIQTLGKDEPSEEKVIRYLHLMTSEMMKPDFESMDSDFMEY